MAVLWIAVAAIHTVAALAGDGLAEVTSGDFEAAIAGLAAGAPLVTLIDTMIPEAAHAGGRSAGLVAVLGFALAAALSSVS